MAIATDTTPGGGHNVSGDTSQEGSPATAQDSPPRARNRAGSAARDTDSASSNGAAPSGATSGESPSKSHLQRMDALARANHIRTQRAKIKRDLKAGRLPIDQLLLDPPFCLHTAKIFDVLVAVPRYGRVKVNKVLLHCRISPSRTVGGLSERQRAELVGLLRR